jgi:hypothetical protein
LLKKFQVHVCDLSFSLYMYRYLCVPKCVCVCVYRIKAVGN